MGKIRYTIRLYPQHDLDLVTLMRTRSFNVPTIAYTALSAFAEGRLFVIEAPPVSEMPDIPNRRVYRKNLILDEEKDAKAIELLESISEGYRNCFIKHLMRLYLCRPFSPEFRAEGSSVDVDSMLDIFRQNRKTVVLGGRRPVRPAGKNAAESKDAHAELKAKNTDMVLKKNSRPDEKEAASRSVDAPAQSPKETTETPEEKKIHYQDSSEDEIPDTSEGSDSDADEAGDVFGLFESINKDFIS